MAAKSCIDFDLLSIEEFCDILTSYNFDDDVVQVFRSNKIDGSIFLELTQEDFKELGVVSLGDRKKMERLKSMANPATEPPLARKRRQFPEVKNSI